MTAAVPFFDKLKLKIPPAGAGGILLFFCQSSISSSRRRRLVRASPVRCSLE